MMAQISDIHVHVHVDAQEDLVHRLKRRVRILERANAEKDAIIEAALALDASQETEINDLRNSLAAKNAEIESATAAWDEFDLDPQFPAPPATPETPQGDANNANAQ
jgi:hypothetical protein